MKNKKLNKSIKISILSAVALLLMFIEFPLPGFPGFLKIDISDLPALIAAFAFGPVEGVIVELVKNVLHGLLRTSTVFVGEIANFFLGSILVFVAGYIYKQNKTKKTAIISLVAGVLAMSIGAGILNYYIFLPMYSRAFHVPLEGFVSMGGTVNPHIADLKELVIWAIVPFNLIKGVLVGSITTLVYKSISPILHDEGKTHYTVESEKSS